MDQSTGHIDTNIELVADYHGSDGMTDLFRRLGQLGDTGFHHTPHSLTPCGDELLVAFATNTLGVDGTVVDVDAVVVWRVYGGRIHEAWDIPAINTVRPHRPDPGSTTRPRKASSHDLR